MKMSGHDIHLVYFILPCCDAVCCFVFDIEEAELLYESE